MLTKWGFLPQHKTVLFLTVSKQRRIRHLLAAALAFGVAACAVRQVTPVAISQSTDDQLTCAQLDQQMKSNQLAAVELLNKNKKVQEANTAKVVASVVFSAWISFSIDLSHEEQIKMRALADRNEELQRLKRLKRCP
jgi:hypothetical protein